MARCTLVAVVSIVHYTVCLAHTHVRHLPICLEDGEIFRSFACPIVYSSCFRHDTTLANDTRQDVWTVGLRGWEKTVSEQRNLQHERGRPVYIDNNEVMCMLRGFSGLGGGGLRGLLLLGVISDYSSSLVMLRVEYWSCDDVTAFRSKWFGCEILGVDFASEH